jgi:RNA polymerase sigma-70 factor (ECF subfamily)
MPGTFSALMPDTEVWKEFKQGKQEVFSFIYFKHYSSLYNYGYKIKPDSAFVEDCLQDMFLVLWKNRESLGDVVSVKAYLFRSFRHKILRRIKENQWLTQQKSLAEEDQAEVMSLEFSIEEVLIKDQTSREQKKRLLDAVNNLSKRQRELIYLRFYKGLSYEEIAQILQLSNQTLRNHIHLALKELRNSLVVLFIVILAIFRF